MASKGKKKTTMAKLARESRLRERQQDKKAKKDARKRAGEQPLVEMAEFDEGTEETAVVPEQGEGALAPVAAPLDD
jgi:hypothetical protein